MFNSKALTFQVIAKPSGGQLLLEGYLWVGVYPEAQVDQLLAFAVNLYLNQRL